MAKFKKLKNILSEKIIGTGVVVTPELVPNQSWDWQTDQSTNNAMVVPSKHFFNYLGHYIAPKEALEAPAGMGYAPFENDLTRTLDVTNVSSPAFLNFNITEDDTEISFASDDAVSLGKDAGGVLVVDEKNLHTYDWDGTWGDTKNPFEISVTFMITVSLQNEKSEQNFDGITQETSSSVKVWAGSANDVDPASGTLKTYYNPIFSTGDIQEGNGGSTTQVFTLTVNRKPTDTQILFNGDISATGWNRKWSNRSWGANDLILATIPIPGGGNVEVKIDGGAVISTLLSPILAILDEIFGRLYEKRFRAESNYNIKVISRKFANFDAQDIQRHPAQKFLTSSDIFDPKAYIYTQFHYPYFDSDPFKVFGSTFYYDKPYLQNESVGGNSYTASRELKAHRYVVTNLSRVMYETNIGVFYEFMLRQLNGSATSTDLNFHIKLANHTTTVNSDTQILSQEPDVYSTILPTDNDLIPNAMTTGLGTSSCFDPSNSFLSSLSYDASKVSYSDQFNLSPNPYSDVYTKYNIGTKASSFSSARIAEINSIIGDFSATSTALAATNGYKVQTWADKCASADYVGLSSSSTAKNLSWKLIEFILWYLDTDGIASETRLSAKSLFEYEKIVNSDIQNYDTTADVDAAGNAVTPDQIVVVGDTIYEKVC